MAEATLDILLNETIGTINPNIYGHFMEHLGYCVEEGCWVGEDSPIANAGGIRTDVTDALRAVGVPVMRWPGGCFADDYHWQDGIGPRSERPKRINIHWGDVLEDNEFGTHEFMVFCKSIEAQPYFCGNLGSGTPAEMRDWVEYCNYPSGSSRAEQRAANGSPDPFKVKFWGVGNENWGCGGNFTPDDYATEYRRYATYMRNWGDDPLYLIGCGPNENDLDWTRRFFTKLRRDHGRGPAIHGYAAHYYTWNHGEYGTATEFDTAQWYGLLTKSLRMEPLVVQQRALMDAFDPQRKIGLIVDEWGAWHPATPGRNPSFLWQQNGVRDALLAALTLDIFNRHADKVVMANIAQTINVLQALLLTDGDRMLKTPTYHIYDLYKPHQGANAVRLITNTAQIEGIVGGKPEPLPTLSGSASVKGNVLTLTIVNAHAADAQTAEIRLSGGTLPASAKSVSLHYPQGQLTAHNDFDAPNIVTLSAESEVTGNAGHYEFAPASVTRLTFALS